MSTLFQLGTGSQGTIASVFGILLVASSSGAEVRITTSVTSPVTMGEPVIAELAIANTFAEPISIDLGVDRRTNLVVTVTRPQGASRTVSLPPQAGVTRTGLIRVRPGATYVQELLLDDWVRFDEVGTYQVALAFTRHFNTDSGQAGPLPDAAVSVTVTARNVEALRQRYAELTAAILSNPYTEKGRSAEHALTSTDDPVIIPFLSDLLKRSHRSDSAVMAALGRIGTPEALELLQSERTSRDPERAALANDAWSRAVARQTR